MKLSICCLGMVFLISCQSAKFASVASPVVSKQDDITSEYAYLYGHFQMSEGSARANGTYMSMAFVLECDDGNQYTFKLSIDNPLKVVQAKPANCSSTKVLYLAEDGSVFEEKATPVRFLVNLDLHAGTAYYLGDYYAKAFRHVFGTGRRGSWNLKRIDDNFKETTASLMDDYQVRSGVNTRNLAARKRTLSAKR